MPEHKQGKKSKRTRKARLNGIAKTTLHKQTRQRRLEVHGCSYHRPRGFGPMFPEITPGLSPTFEQEYKKFHQTRGRKGLNPNPLYRQPENHIYLSRNSIFNVRRVPIGELMQKPINNSGTFRI